MGNAKDRGGGGGVFENIKVFLKNQKHEANIVEITHLCIMHGAHTLWYAHTRGGSYKPKVTQFDVSDFVYFQ